MSETAKIPVIDDEHRLLFLRQPQNLSDMDIQNINLFNQ